MPGGKPIPGGIGGIPGGIAGGGPESNVDRMFVKAALTKKQLILRVSRKSGSFFFNFV